MKRARIAACLAGAVVLSLIVPGTTTAAPSGCRFANTTVYWKAALTNSAAYLNPAQWAARNWHMTSSPIRFQQVTTKANVSVADGVFGSTGYDGIAKFGDGTNLRCPTSGPWTQGLVVWWNRTYTDRYSGEKKLSVMVHELGHALGLNHESFSSCNYVSIMQPDTATRYDLCKRTTPSVADVAFINQIYGESPGLHLSRVKNYHSVAELRADSKTVVVGTASSSRVQYVNDIPMTFTKFRIDRAVGGQATGADQIEIAQLGGDGTASPDSSPLLAAGSRYLLFLNPGGLPSTATEPVYAITGDQGVFRVSPSGAAFAGAPGLELKGVEGFYN